MQYWTLIVNHFLGKGRVLKSVRRELGLPVGWWWLSINFAHSVNVQYYTHARVLRLWHFRCISRVSQLHRCHRRNCEPSSPCTFSFQHMFQFQLCMKLLFREKTLHLWWLIIIVHSLFSLFYWPISCTLELDTYRWIQQKFQGHTNNFIIEMPGTHQ